MRGSLVRRQPDDQLGWPLRTDGSRAQAAWAFATVSGAMPDLNMDASCLAQLWRVVLRSSSVNHLTRIDFVNALRLLARIEAQAENVNSFACAPPRSCAPQSRLP
jgi:hypothetical protein